MTSGTRKKIGNRSTWRNCLLPDVICRARPIHWANQPIGSWFAAPARAIHAGQHQALAIRRILEINRRLEPDRKIRVISMSIGWGPKWLSSTAAAVEEARRAGILVSSLDLGTGPDGPVRIASSADPDRYIMVFLEVGRHGWQSLH